MLPSVAGVIQIPEGSPAHDSDQRQDAVLNATRMRLSQLIDSANPVFLASGASNTAFSSHRAVRLYDRHHGGRSVPTAASG